jgi:putative transposase
VQTGYSQYRKQCQRWDVPYAAHCLTFSCYQRRPFLIRERTCQWFIDALSRAREKHGFHLWAWVLMPEHVHLVIWIPTDARICDILKSVKLSVSKKAVRWLSENRPGDLKKLEHVQAKKMEYRFWQAGGGYERLLRSPGDVHEKIRYVHANPVKRGLVEQAVDWRWSSAQAYENGTDTPISLDREFIPIVVNYK